MAQHAIPEDIRRFVLTSIPSVPHLEALLLLRAAPGPWSTAEVAERLYLGEKPATGLLDDLCQSGMAVAATTEGAQARYHYQPVSEFLRETIDSLADFYARHLVDVTHLIHSKHDRKAQQFADAFKWRKDS
ncbi:hypothetical protein [Massilia soli]|uniref:Transcriptional regulator n=1 Tax=Massilia soli TaxID=2792854 RepID=A0ABS7SUQ6_9BURK|nr:hypothetical protein [Massilia soli]MBZ2209692.1 hypothetical protein [Massilia soli]